MEWSEYDIRKALLEIRRRVASGKSVRAALRQYSKESGIPEGTLHRWYYPRKSERRRALIQTIRDETKGLEREKEYDPSQVEIVSPKLYEAALFAVLEVAIRKKLAEWNTDDE